MKLCRKNITPECLMNQRKCVCQHEAILSENSPGETVREKGIIKSNSVTRDKLTEEKHLQTN